MTRPAEVPSCQMNLDEALAVDAAEYWMHPCPHCHDAGRPAMIQGGHAGMAAHRATVHGAEQVAR